MALSTAFIPGQQCRRSLLSGIYERSTSSLPSSLKVSKIQSMLSISKPKNSAIVSSNVKQITMRELEVLACADDSSAKNTQNNASTSALQSNNGVGNGGKKSALPKPLSMANQHLLSKYETFGQRVAYQGVPGAYSEAAAVKAYPDCQPVPCDQFEAAFQALELWLVDRAVLPIENSLGGSIHRNYDLMLRHKLHIVGEVQLPVHHCLLALPGTKIETLTRVMSHPQALAQCENSLTQLGVTITRESVLDTAGAAQTIANEKIADAGAIASARAAEIYGLDILADGIQDDDDNVTRFLILAREPIMPQTDRPWKTSIVFSLEIGPGVLFKALSVFALRDINLTKIESRPQKNRDLWEMKSDRNGNLLVEDAQQKGYHLFDYLFYIDFQASMAEERAQNALRHLQEFAPFLRVLGSYPMDVSPIAKL